MTKNRRGNIRKARSANKAGTAITISIPLDLVVKYGIRVGDELEWSDDEGYIRFKRLGGAGKIIELWSNPTCKCHEQAKALIGQTSLEWKYVDVYGTEFEGVIPRLVLKNGRHIIGIPAIKQYVESVGLEK